MSRRFVFTAVAGIAIGVLFAVLVTRSSSRTAPYPREADSSSALQAVNDVIKQRPNRRQPPLLLIEDEVVRDPSAEGYNPVRLSAIDMPTAEIFGQEPRDPVWSPVMEQRLSAQVARDLEFRFGTAVQLVKAECRTSSCELTVLAPEAQAQDAEDTLVVPPLGDVITPQRGALQEDGRREVRLLLLIDREHREPVAYDLWYAMVRARQLEALRALGHVVPER